MTVNFKSNVTSNNVNTAFVSKTADDEKSSDLTLNNGNTTQVDSIQDFTNQIADTNGETEGDAQRKDYSSNNKISNGDNRKVAIGKLDAAIQVNDDDIQSINDSVGAANGICPLDGNADVPIENLPDAVLGGPKFIGTWNADTNTPDVSATTPAQGDYYRVSVAGTTNLDGITDWGVGDWAIYNGTSWDKIDNSESVTSVNGQNGVVVLDTDDISEGATNLYYEEARVTANTSVVANTAKVTNANHTGEVTGSSTLTADKTIITNKTTVTPEAGDFVLISDSSDSDNLKKVNANDFLTIAGGGGVKKIGFDATTGNSINMTTNHLHATRVTAPLSSTITRLGIFFGSNTAGRNVVLGIYSDSSGTPDSLLAQTSEYAVAAGGSEARIRYFDLDSSVNLVEDTDYWLAVHPDNNCTVEIALNNNTSGGQVYRNVTYSTTMPASFGSITGNSSGHVSMAGY